MIGFANSIEAHCSELPAGSIRTSTVAHYGAGPCGDGTRVRAGRSGRRRAPRAADFAIWRKTPPGKTRQWNEDSPVGQGRPAGPGSSVMSGQLLGFPFDIHTGGIDHREIHHPNEIAQNQAFCGSDASGANIWMHNNFLVERSGKMSKSAGEFLRLQLLIDRGYHPLAYRLMCLQAHYRSELEFSWEGLQAALVRLKRMAKVIYSQLYLAQEATVRTSQSFRLSGDPSLKWSSDDETEILIRFDQAASDDLNSAMLLPLLEEIWASK